MKSARQCLQQNARRYLAQDRDWKRFCHTIGVVACVPLICAMIGCSSEKRSSQPASSSQPAQEAQTQPALSAQSGAFLTDADLKTKSPDQLAAFIFENHGCKNCHTLGASGKLGFTDRGKRVGKNFEGCIRLLTAMNVIAQVKEQNRTAEDKERAARFEEFGCSTCHQITPGKLGLTEYGSKLASLHLACTDVQSILASNPR